MVCVIRVVRKIRVVAELPKNLGKTVVPKFASVPGVTYIPVVTTLTVVPEKPTNGDGTDNVKLYPEPEQNHASDHQEVR
jgi:hypothetical protein